MLDDYLASVPGSVETEAEAVGADNNAGDCLFDARRCNGHIVIPYYVHQLDSCIHNVLERSEHPPVVLENFLIEGITVGLVEGERQVPLIQDITVEHHFPYICCSGDSIEEFDQMGTVFQNFSICILNAEVNIAENNDFIAGISRIPERMDTCLSRCSGRTAHYQRKQCSNKPHVNPFSHAASSGRPGFR